MTAPLQTRGTNTKALPITSPRALHWAATALLLGVWLTLFSVSAWAAPRSTPIVRDDAHEICLDCGRVEQVIVRKEAGKATGVGAVLGGVIGGSVARHMDRQDAGGMATVLGAVGGGLLGHHLETRMRRATVYDVEVLMDDGTRRTLSQDVGVERGQRVLVQRGIARPWSGEPLRQGEPLKRNPMLEKSPSPSISV